LQQFIVELRAATSVGKVILMVLVDDAPGHDARCVWGRAILVKMALPAAISAPPGDPPAWEDDAPPIRPS
jgi:hypothetical protein